MCTSFTVYNSKPIYGMNFDFPDIELKFDFLPGPVGDVFYLSFEWGGRYHQVAGLNAAGLFSAAQILVAPFDIHHLPEEPLVSPYEVFSGALKSGQVVDDVLQLLDNRRLGYSTGRKGHQLYADRRGGTCILEPGPEGNRVYCSRDDYTVMTNTPVEREKLRAAQNMARLGIDRYHIARRMIQEKFEHFSIEDGFDVLQQTQLLKGRFTTQSSIVCDPEAGAVFLSIKRDFEKIWRLSFEDRSAETHRGFQHHRKITIDKSGITATRLIEQSS